MDRRTFLKTTGAAMASAQFLGAQSGTSQIQHVVVAMMENRSFDHLFGWLPNANGRQAGLSYLDNDGNSHATFPLAPDFTGCDYDDPDHSYSGARLEYDGGKMDGFLKPASNSVYAIGYYREQDLPSAPRWLGTIPRATGISRPFWRPLFRTAFSSTPGRQTAWMTTSAFARSPPSGTI
jgi:phospholipase C